MKRAGEKSSTKLGLVIAAFVAVVVACCWIYFLIHFGGISHLAQLKDNWNKFNQASSQI
ncbi:MAG: hypothetical protein ACLRZG_03590 [Streptococcus sp.]